jgi:CBS domain-containing protein
MDVSALMTKEVISAKPSDLITDIAKIMHEKRIHALPVLDEEKRVLGIITESDFFTKEANDLTYLPALVDTAKKEDGGKGMGGSSKVTAGDIMTSPCRVLPQNAGAEEFIRIVKETGFISVPVVSSLAENKLVGVITVADVMNIM